MSNPLDRSPAVNNEREVLGAGGNVTNNAGSRYSAGPVTSPKPVLNIGEVSEKPWEPPVTTDITEQAKKIADGQIGPQPQQEKTYDDEALQPLIDGLMKNGYAVDVFGVGPKRVVLRSRFAWEEREVFARLDKAGLVTAAAYQTELSILMLAASIAQFGEFVENPVNFGDAKLLSESFDRRLAFVTSLNNVFQGILEQKLWILDDKLRYIMKNSDKLIKNF